MRIILIGQAAFAQEVLDGLQQQGHEIVAVYCPPDAPGGRVDPVKERAQALHIPVQQHASLKAPGVAEEFAGYQADLAVLAYVTQIVPRAVFDVPRLGSICFHPSPLPRYRGGSAVNWQIIKGENETAVSVFWVDPGIDTGPIIVQKSAPIGPEDSAGSLYYNTLFALGVAAVLEAVQLIAADKAPRLPQDESLATYDPLCGDEHAGIDWACPVVQVYNLIRGCDPQPGARTSWKGETLRLYNAQCVTDGEFTPGVVADISDAGLTIGAVGGGVRVARVRYGADKKGSAADFARTHGVTVGSQLG